MGISNADIKTKVKEGVRNVWKKIKEYSIVVIGVIAGTIFFILTGKEILHNRKSAGELRDNTRRAKGKAEDAGERIDSSLEINRELESGAERASGIIEKIRNEQSLE